MRKLLLLSTALVLLCAQSWAWGREGHRIIAAVAEDHLDETSKVMIQSLIGNNHLYSIASWADDIRRERPETKTWHYVNIPLGSTYDAARDCAPGCVVATIDDLVKVLTDKNAPRDQRAEALKFLVHFVGDVHQPMHAVKEAAGGNGIHVSFLDSARCGPYECSLHGVWDTSMILRTGMKQEEYVQHEEELVKTAKLEREDGGTAVQWANESVGLAQAAWVANGASLDDGYYQKEIKVVDRQMAVAGLRLAKLLNDTIGKLTPRDFAQSDMSDQRPQATGSKAAEAANVKVWANLSSGVYHCPATQWYGNTKHGEYMTQAEAQHKGYHPVGGKICQ
jgi:hypothetical protein